MWEEYKNIYKFLDKETWKIIKKTKEEILIFQFKISNKNNIEKSKETILTILAIFLWFFVWIPLVIFLSLFLNLEIAKMIY